MATLRMPFSIWKCTMAHNQNPATPEGRTCLRADYFTYIQQDDNYVTRLKVWRMSSAHSSFYNPSLALPTSQLIPQPFRCFTYVTAHSPTLLSPLLRHRIFTYVTWRAAQSRPWYTDTDTDTHTHTHTHRQTHTHRGLFYKSCFSAKMQKQD